MQNGFTDNELWCVADVGSSGNRVWVKGGAVVARALFDAGRMDKGGNRQALEAVVKISGRYVAAFPIVRWGKRVWQAFETANGRTFGRWRMPNVLGEFNERNAASPPLDIEFGETTDPAPAGPPPLIDRKCFRYYQFYPASALEMKLFPLNVTRGHNAIEITPPEGFRADKYSIGYDLTVETPQGPVFFLAATTIADYPIINPPVTEQYRTLPVNPKRAETFILHEPATLPATFSRRFLFDEPYTIFPHETLLYKKEGNTDPQPGYYEHYEGTSKLLDNWHDFGNVGLFNILRPDLVDFAPGSPRTVRINVQLHYTAVAPGYKLGWGQTISFLEKSCKKPAPVTVEEGNVCTSGMAIEGNCLVIETCDDNGNKTGTRVCAGEEAGVPFLRAIFGATQEGRGGRTVIELGGDATVTYEDEDGYTYPILNLP